MSLQDELRTAAKDSGYLTTNVTVHVLIEAADELDRLTTALSASQKECDALRRDAEWQPIETAPKDGTEILLCSAVIRDIGVCYWCDRLNDWTWGLGNKFLMPKHWKPLPAPPDTAREQT